MARAFRFPDSSRVSSSAAKNCRNRRQRLATKTSVKSKKIVADFNLLVACRSKPAAASSWISRGRRSMTTNHPLARTFSLSFSFWFPPIVFAPRIQRVFEQLFPPTRGVPQLRPLRFYLRKIASGSIRIRSFGINCNPQLSRCSVSTDEGDRQ